MNDNDALYNSLVRLLNKHGMAAVLHELGRIEEAKGKENTARYFEAIADSIQVYGHN